MERKKSRSNAQSAPRARLSRAARYALRLDAELSDPGSSATGALEAAMHDRRLKAVGAVVHDFAAALLARNDLQEPAAVTPCPSESLPPMP